MVDNHLTIGDFHPFSTGHHGAMGGRVRPVHPPKLNEWNLKMMGFPSLGSMLDLRGGCEILLETNWKEKEKEVGKYFMKVFC